MSDERINNCNEDELGAMLHRLLIIEGNEEVVIYHPVEGEQVITKKDFIETQKHLKRAKNMSPAERLVETKRIKNKKQMRFRTAMIDAPVYVVNIEDDETFGFDVDGSKMDIEQTVFVPVEQYVSGIELKENELGCFISESLHKPPIRVVKQVLPESKT